MQLEIKAQLFLIKKLWSELLEYQRNYENEAMFLVDNLKENLETQLKIKITSSPSSFHNNLRDSQTSISETLSKKEKTISVLLNELEKLNNFINMKSSNAGSNQKFEELLQENLQFKELLNSKEIEILTMDDKIKEYEGVFNYNKLQIQTQNQKIQDLTEKNSDLMKLIKGSTEMIHQGNRPQESLKDLETPIFKENEVLSSNADFMSKEEYSESNLFEKKLNKKNIKFNFSGQMATKTEEMIKDQKKINEKPNENENEKKRHLDEIKRLKEKIYGLTIERENLIWNESNAVRQLNEFQMEKGKLEILEGKNNNDVNSVKKYKKSQTMNLALMKNEEELPVIYVKKEEKLIGDLEYILKLIEIL